MLKAFTKMEGCGNDYIYFNCLDTVLEHPEEISIKVSDRHFGIGGDGIVLICASQVADARMRMFNNDGSEAQMCGNAIRCVGKYLYDNRIINKQEITIETLGGIKHLELLLKDNKVEKVRVNMGHAILEPKLIPVALEGEQVVDKTVTIGDKEEHITCVSMGNPHCIVFRDEVKDLELEKIGPVFENAAIFPDKINTEFIKIIDEHTLEMRVWERGSGETLACGTGACAAVVAAILNGYCKKDEDITVKLRGGELIIRYTDKTIYMTGSAKKTFEGVVHI